MKRALWLGVATLANACSWDWDSRDSRRYDPSSTMDATPGDETPLPADSAPDVDSATGVDSGPDVDGGATWVPDAGTTTTMEVSFYGWADNSPPGADIAYPDIHAHAGGAGTYADPITFATDPTEFAPGTVLYVPVIAKYVLMEDECSECETDWRAHRFHIDVWMNSDATHTAELFACEDHWGRDATAVETNPPSDRPVTAAPLFDPATGICSPGP